MPERWCHPCGQNIVTPRLSGRFFGDGGGTGVSRKLKNRGYAASDRKSCPKNWHQSNSALPRFQSHFANGCRLRHRGTGFAFLLQRFPCWSECCDGRSDQPDGGDRPTNWGDIPILPAPGQTFGVSIVVLELERVGFFPELTPLFHRRGRGRATRGGKRVTLQRKTEGHRHVSIQTEFRP